MVAYLLGKKNKTNIASEFRKKFLIDVINKSELSNSIAMNIIEPNVYREKYNIDIIIEYSRLTIAIENKIDANESPNQIRNYQKKLDLFYPDRNKILILRYISTYERKVFE